MAISGLAPRSSCALFHQSVSQQPLRCTPWGTQDWFSLGPCSPGFSGLAESVRALTHEKVVSQTQRGFHIHTPGHTHTDTRRHTHKWSQPHTHTPTTIPHTYTNTRGQHPSLPRAPAHILKTTLGHWGRCYGNRDFAILIRGPLNSCSEYYISHGVCALNSESAPGGQAGQPTRELVRTGNSRPDYFLSE